jgi:hypothetical protein
MLKNNDLIANLITGAKEIKWQSEGYCAEGQ